MGVVAAGLFAQRFPSLHGDVTVGLGREHQHHFGGIDVDTIFGNPWLTPSSHGAIELAQRVDFVCVFQPMPLPPLPSLFISGPGEVKRLKVFG